MDCSRTAGSTFGSSRISTPRRRATGVSTPASPFELGVAAAIVEQRTSLMRLRALHRRDEQRVVAAVVMLEDSTLEMRQRVVDQHDTAVAARICNTIEAVGRLVGK